MPLLSIAFVGVLAGNSACSVPLEESAFSFDALSSVDVEVTRNPGDPILGEVDETGACDASIIDINHQKNTAHITYKGQPGDDMFVRIVLLDGSEESYHCELGRGHTEWQIPTTIFNGDIDRTVADFAASVCESVYEDSGDKFVAAVTTRRLSSHTG